MQTVKSACLMIVLLGVLYGVYVALNKPDLAMSSGTPAENAADPTIDYGSATAPSTSWPAPLAPTRPDTSPADAAADRSARGGAYEPRIESPALTPPNPPAGGLQQSAYEAPLSGSSAEIGSNSPSALSTDKPSPSLVNAPASSLPSDPAAPSPALAAYDLKRDMAEIEQMVAAGKFKSALARLTPHYHNASLAEEQRRQVLSWLDALAAKVIYSREHLVAPAHFVRKGEDLYQIAQQYSVEYRLLQNINQEVTDPQVLVPATELKVIPGPFRAEVKLAAGELTLYVGDLYAGRFSFALGDQPPAAGAYKVVDKRAQQKTYVGFDGRVIPANDPNNPYGGWWIGLGGEVAIHGSPLSPAPKTLGCISLSPQDAKDLYGILSIGSEVKIEP